ncbi:predicted GPI-anchored protein 58 [Phragmites australis]|uniref:predicted GPI-anchored protein 58 n=1 Tax=Phragmites australis TaxID=29695 RepID=UPI002D77208F|nr:predicted GPI-anchored protein 58 [Phragmites australis]
MGNCPRSLISLPSSSSSSPSPPPSPHREPRPTAGDATAGDRTGQLSRVGSGADAGTSSQWPSKGSPGGWTSPEQPRPSPVHELRAQAGSAPSPPTGEEQPASGEAVVTRVALARPLLGSPSASAEKAPRGPSSRPSTGQALEPLPEVLEAAIAAKRAELKEERTALINERGRLEEDRKLLENRVATARTAYERTL